MKILFTSDWHLCMRNLEACGRVVNQLVDLTKKHNPLLVHCGDILGDRGPANPVDQRVTNFLISAVSRLKANSSGFLFVRGNHDMISGPDGVPSCCPLLRSLGVTAADQEWQMFQSPLRSLVNIWMVPYFRDPKKQRAEFTSVLEERKKSKARFHILVFHNEIKGCERNATAKGEGLTLSDIGAPEYDACIGGHVHRPQKMEPNVWFVGNPFPSDWGDANQLKRHLLMEI